MLQVYTSPSELRPTGLRVLVASAVVVAAAVAVSAHVTRKGFSANGAVADVTLDNEGPETNAGGGWNTCARKEEKPKSTFRRQGGSMTTCHDPVAMMTPCARDQS